MRVIILSSGRFMLIITAVLLILNVSGGLCDYRRGDINNDGWCNIADLMALVCYFQGTTTLNCEIAADINGDGMILGSDISQLINFLRGIGNEPENACPLDVVPCEDFTVKPVIYIGPASFAGNICTLPVYMGAPNTPAVEVSSFHFSMYYDPLVFTAGSFEAVDVIGNAGEWDRPFPPSYGLQPDNIVAFFWYPDGNCPAFPIGNDTHVFDIEVTMVSPVPTGNVNYLCVLDEDPIMGQPRFYLDLTGGDHISNDCLHVFCPAHLTGDVNGDKRVIGGDVTRLVSYFQGIMSLERVDFRCVPVRW